MFETFVQDFAMRKKTPSSLKNVWHRPNRFKMTTGKAEIACRFVEKEKIIT